MSQGVFCGKITLFRPGFHQIDRQIPEISHQYVKKVGKGRQRNDSKSITSTLATTRLNHWKHSQYSYTNTLASKYPTLPLSNRHGPQSIEDHKRCTLFGRKHFILYCIFMHILKWPSHGKLKLANSCGKTSKSWQTPSFTR